MSESEERIDIAAHNLRVWAELRSILSVLAEARIPCVVLKGVPLMRQIGLPFGGHALADNDILVSPTDASRAVDAMHDIGYRSMSHRSLVADMRTNFEHPLVRPEGEGFLVCEIHWHAVSPHLFRPCDAAFWTRVREVKLDDTTVPVLDPTASIVQLAAHFMQHELCEPRTLRVLAAAWDEWAPLVDVAQLQDLAAATGTTHAIVYALNAAAHVGLLRSSPPSLLSRRATVLARMLRPESLLTDATEHYPQRYFRTLGSLWLAAPSRAARTIRMRLFPPLDAFAAETPEATSWEIAKRLAARPTRALARVQWANRTVPQLAIQVEYLRARRRIARQYESEQLHRLLRQLTPDQASSRTLRLTDLLSAIRSAERLAAKLRVRPDTCLFRALARYSVLARHGFQPTFFLGYGGSDPGHAWVSVAGKPVLEPGTPMFPPTYSYPGPTTI